MLKRLTIALTLVSCLVAALAAAPAVTSWGAGGITIEHNKNENLDGAVLVSPGAERITTRLPDGGGPIGPGVTALRALLIQNRSKATITVDLGLSQVLGSSNPQDQVTIHDGIGGSAAWVTLKGTTATLRPGDKATVQMVIKIPTGIKPGSKAFAVTVTQRNTSGASTGAQVTPIYRQVAIFIVDLPGNAPVKGHITDASIHARNTNGQAANDKKGTRHWYFGSHKFEADVAYANKGERLLTPQGRVTVTDIFGRVVGTYTIPRFTAYPDGAAAATVSMRKLPAFGLLHSKLTLESDAGKQTRQLGYLVVAPWWGVFVAVVLLLVLVVAIVRYLLDRRRWNQLAAEEIDDDSEGDHDDDDDDDDVSDDPYANEIEDDDQ